MPPARADAEFCASHEQWVRRYCCTRAGDGLRGLRSGERPGYLGVLSATYGDSALFKYNFITETKGLGSRFFRLKFSVLASVTYPERYIIVKYYLMLAEQSIS